MDWDSPERQMSSLMRHLSNSEVVTSKTAAIIRRGDCMKSLIHCKINSYVLIVSDGPRVPGQYSEIVVSQQTKRDLICSVHRRWAGDVNRSTQNPYAREVDGTYRRFSYPWSEWGIPECFLDLSSFMASIAAFSRRETNTALKME